MASHSAERAGKVGLPDSARYRREAASLGERLAAAGSDEQGVWEVYAGTEKLIAVLKFRLDYETPGVFTKLPDASDPARLLEEARALLSRSAEEIAEGALVDSIETLRGARNDLRSYLTEKRESVTRSRTRRNSRGNPSER